MAINYPRIVALFILFAVTPDAVTANQVLGVPPEDDLGAVQLSTHGTIPNDPSLRRTPDPFLWIDDTDTVTLDSTLENMYKIIGFSHDDFDIFDIDKDLVPELYRFLNVSERAVVGYFAKFMSYLDMTNDRYLSWDELLNGSAIIAGAKALYADLHNNVEHLQELFQPFGLKFFGTDSPHQHSSNGGDADKFPLEDLVKRFEAGWDSKVSEVDKKLNSLMVALGAGIKSGCPKCFDALMGLMGLDTKW